MTTEPKITANLKEAKFFDTQNAAMTAAFQINEDWRAAGKAQVAHIDGGAYIGFWLLAWEADSDNDRQKLLGIIAA